MAGHMEFEFNIRGETTGRQREHTPFNLLVLGNFSGHAAQVSGEAGENSAKGRIVGVDLDNIDRLMSHVSPRLSLQTGSTMCEFCPRDIDDFHPDQLFRMLPVFKEFREVRKNLLDPGTAQSTLDQILSTRTVIEGEIVEDPEHPDQAASDEDSGEMFERLLGRSARPPQPPPGQSPELQKLDAFIRDLVAPHIVHDPDPRVETALDSIDLGIAEQMRRILHHPEFQALEGGWRSLLDLVSELELDENLQLYVCDIQRDELLAALPDPGTALQDSALFQLLVENRRQAADDTPWSLILGDYHFGPDPEDIALLTALGAAAASNGGVFIGGARPEILGCKSTAELADAKYWTAPSDAKSLWQSLRTSPVAGHIGLALPRVLARLPYGENTEEIDSFVFEEMPQRNHEDYLWANPAYACGRLLAEQFTRSGWQMEPGDHVDLGYLPAHHFEEDGESRLQPCAELLLSESTMVAMFEQGLMPLISYRNQNTAVLGRFQSIASPAAALAGPWR
jgi:type VI secretion system protein ImpC